MSPYPQLSGNTLKAVSHPFPRALSPAPGVTVWRLLRDMIGMLTYDIDNNAVERSIRPLTLGRKNWLFVDGDESARDTAIYMTLAGSCNLLGITPYKYFMAILPQLHTGMTNEEYERLLPYAIAEKMR